MNRIQEEVESKFSEHALGLGLKPGTKKFAKHERLFFAGACVAVHAAYPPPLIGQMSEVLPGVWTGCLTSGARVIECLPAS